MKNGLVEKIKDVGYWRVNFKPTVPLANKLTLNSCKEFVVHNRVSLRGWDYPPFIERQDKEVGFGNFGEYFESWCDWHNYVEFWRMYKSSQFLHYKALWEDLDPDRGNQPADKVLSVRSAIYTITEIVEFLFRLHRAGLYPNGAILNISLHNADNRQLWINDPMRMGFSDEKVNLAPEIILEKTYSSSELKESAQIYSLDSILQLFDNFSWIPSQIQIESDQIKFYNRQI
jgi:hypothetical protein